MLERPVTRTLLGMAAPIALSMLATFLFQVVDTWFVGQLGPEALAALGFAATTYFLGVALFMGLAVGTSALVGEALGGGDAPLARRYATVSIGFCLVVATGLAAVGIATIEPLFVAMGADPTLVPLIEQYMTVLYAGMPLLVFALAAEAPIRATGDVISAAVVMGLAGVINVVADYVLIFGRGPFPRLELTGAAVATVLSWGFAALAMLALLHQKGLLTRRSGDLRRELAAIVRLSTPAVATQVLLPLTAMFVTYLAARSGADAVAAFGVAQRVETLGLVGVSAVTLALVPFVAQNAGAQAFDRVREAVRFAVRTALVWGGGLGLLLAIFATPIAGLFSRDPEVMAHTRAYFYALGPAYAPFALVTLSAALLNGAHRPEAALRVLVVKTFLLTAPLAALGSLTLGATGLFAGLALSHLLSAAHVTFVGRRALADLSPTTEDHHDTTNTEEPDRRLPPSGHGDPASVPDGRLAAHRSLRVPRHG